MSVEGSGRTDMLFQFFWTLCQFISSFARLDHFIIMLGGV